MKIISRLGKNVDVEVAESAAHRGNEAELRKAIIRYCIDGVLNEKSVLLRECIRGNKETHNAEIRHTYDQLREINAKYDVEGKKFRVNLVKHFTDEEGNIYVKDLNPTEEISAYDLLPDGYYLDESRKSKSRFGEFKKNVANLADNRMEIVASLFEQLAILHANGFVVGTLVECEKEVTHPTLSLFLCRLKNRKSQTDVKVYVHDIHNLVEIPSESSVERLRHCVRDLRDLSFDIIRFFKGIGLPHMGFRRYGEVLRELNRELYTEVYSAFLWDPKIEIESMAFEGLGSVVKFERKESRQVVDRLSKEPDKAKDLKLSLRNDGIFMFGIKREAVTAFLESANPENVEFIFDFDGTLTAPGSKNALHAAVSNSGYSMESDSADGFFFRKGAIAFLRLLISSGFVVKIHSLGFKNVIVEVLRRHGVNFDEENVYANDLDSPRFSKSEIPVSTDSNKRQIFLGDNPVDFETPSPNGSLKIGFVTSKDSLWMNAATDFYHLEKSSDYVYLYHLFRKYLKIR